MNNGSLGPESSREAQRGPERLRKTQRCSERPREAHVDPDSKSCSFSLFVRMSCVDKNAGQSSYFGEDMCWNACNACRHQREQIATAMLQASAIKSRENYVDD